MISDLYEDLPERQKNNLRGLRNLSENSYHSKDIGETRESFRSACRKSGD